MFTLALNVVVLSLLTITVHVASPLHEPCPGSAECLIRVSGLAWGVTAVISLLMLAYLQYYNVIAPVAERLETNADERGVDDTTAWQWVRV